MIKITKILESGGVAPYQLSALTNDGREIYLRYRNGRLRWGFVEKGRIIPDQYEFSSQIGGFRDGWPDDELFKEILKNQLEFPDGFVFKSKYKIELEEV